LSGSIDQVSATHLHQDNASGAPEFPYWIPGDGNKYQYSDLGWWTSGFFPGSLWLLYERALLGQTALPAPQLLRLARSWSKPIESNKDRTDSHDLGFLLGDSFGWDHKLTKDPLAAEVLVRTAHSLASRYSDIVKCMRSWDTISGHPDPSKSFLVIIDNMMSQLLLFSLLQKALTTETSDLELLFYVAELTRNKRLYQIAENHSLTTMRNQIRADGSHWHVLNYDQKTGSVSERFTWQGYADNSTWARGQAWGLYGFANAYKWTKRKEFLVTAKRMAHVFAQALPTDGVPFW
jgi:hypothetical protein